MTMPNYTKSQITRLLQQTELYAVLQMNFTDAREFIALNEYVQDGTEPNVSISSTAINTKFAALQTDSLAAVLRGEDDTRASSEIVDEAEIGLFSTAAEERIEAANTGGTTGKPIINTVQAYINYINHWAKHTTKTGYEVFVHNKLMSEVQNSEGKLSKACDYCRLLHRLNNPQFDRMIPGTDRTFSAVSEPTAAVSSNRDIEVRSAHLVLDMSNVLTDLLQGDVLELIKIDARDIFERFTTAVIEDLQYDDTQKSKTSPVILAIKRGIHSCVDQKAGRFFSSLAPWMKTAKEKADELYLKANEFTLHTSSSNQKKAIQNYEFDRAANIDTIQQLRSDLFNMTTMMQQQQQSFYNTSRTDRTYADQSFFAAPRVPHTPCETTYSAETLQQLIDKEIERHSSIMGPSPIQIFENAKLNRLIGKSDVEHSTIKLCVIARAVGHKKISQTELSKFWETNTELKSNKYAKLALHAICMPENISQEVYYIGKGTGIVDNFVKQALGERPTPSSFRIHGTPPKRDHEEYLEISQAVITPTAASSASQLKN